MGIFGISVLGKKLRVLALSGVYEVDQAEHFKEGWRAVYQGEGTRVACIRAAGRWSLKSFLEQAVWEHD